MEIESPRIKTLGNAGASTGLSKGLEKGSVSPHKELKNESEIKTQNGWKSMIHGTKKGTLESSRSNRVPTGTVDQAKQARTQNQMSSLGPWG